MAYTHKYATLVEDNIEIGLEVSRGNVLYLSHAHSDHLRSPRKKKGVIVSKESFDLAKWGKKYNPEILDLKGIKLFNAGHILGSTQLFAEIDGGSLVYTGDFKLKDGLTTKGAEIKECDTLIIESTYARPDITFPNYEAVYAEIHNWVNRNDKSTLIFGGYSLGKSQEIIKILNEYCGIIPIVNEKTEHFCQIYERYGIKLDRVLIGTQEAEEIMKNRFVAVMPQRMVNTRFTYKLSYALNNEVLCAVASGQGLLRPMNVDKQFLLSDHADFEDIIKYIEQANPKQIFCAHGNEYLMAKELRKKGYNAMPYSSMDSSQRRFNTL